MESLPPAKVCCTCKSSKPATTEFWHRHKNGKLGLSPRCKDCTKAHTDKNAAKARAKRWYQANPERARETKAAWTVANPGYQSTYTKKHYAENREAYLARATQIYQADVEAGKARGRAYYLKNRGAHLSRGAQRRVLERSAGEGYTQQDVLKLLKAQKSKCWWCLKNCADNYHVDHRIPLSKGGAHDPSNIVISCPPCNLSKRAKLPHEWIGRLL